MKKIFFFSVLLLVCMSPALAQVVINADKNYVPANKGNTVNVTAVAIPGDMPNDVDTVSENYHRTVVARNLSPEGKPVPAVVEIAVPASLQDPSAESRVKKEAIPIAPQGSLPVKNVMPKEVEINAAAVKD